MDVNGSELRKQVLLACRGQMRIDCGDQVDRCKFRLVVISIHESLNRLHYLALHILEP